MHSPPLFRPLTKRPAATTITIRELLQKVQGGEIRVPRFQRPLRWTRSHVIQLLDSVWRGYPVGSLLIWKRRAESESIRVGGAYLQAPVVPDAWWVVDGQQRTTALAACLLDLDHGGDTRWVVRFDPLTRQFLSGPVPPDRIGFDVPLSVLGDLRRLGRWLRECLLDKESSDLVEDAQQRLLDYSLPAYVVETDDEQALRGVFARLNSTGARMRADEVFQALLGVPAESGQPSLDLNAMQQNCDIDGFGQPPRADVLKAVLAMSGLDPSRRLDELGSLNTVSLVAPDDALQAMTRTVEFLIAECQIPHVSLIPYPVVFLILCRWFYLHPDSNRLTRRLLSRWVWRGAASGAHHRGEVSTMRQQVRDIKAGDEIESLRRLLAKVGTRPTQPWALRKFNLQSAPSRMEVLALYSLKPRDRLGCIKLPELVSGGRTAREVFRSEDWKKLKDDDRVLAQTAANRVLLGSRHHGLSTEIRGWAWPQDQQALESHLFDAESYRSLVEQDTAAVLHRRSQAVREAMQTFLMRAAAWDEPDLYPLDSYLETADA